MTAALHTVPRHQVVVRPAPRREPPFEDELPPSTLLPGYDQVLPFVRPPARRRPLIPDPRRGNLPEPTAWGRRLLVGLIETADGRRPLGQLRTLLSPAVGHGIAVDLERAAVSRRPHWLHRAVVRSIRATEPAEGVAELCATVECGERVRAIAFRLETHQGRWRCTRLQLG